MLPISGEIILSHCDFRLSSLISFYRGHNLEPESILKYFFLNAEMSIHSAILLSLSFH